MQKEKCANFAQQKLGAIQIAESRRKHYFWAEMQESCEKIKSQKVAERAGQHVAASARSVFGGGDWCGENRQARCDPAAAVCPCSVCAVGSVLE